MASAFDAAWQRLESSESRLIAQAGVTHTRNVLAKIVVELASQGIRDQQELCTHALAQLRATQGSTPEITGSGDRMLH